MFHVHFPTLVYRWTHCPDDVLEMTQIRALSAGALTEVTVRVNTEVATEVRYLQTRSYRIYGLKGGFRQADIK